jgi:hypothetical protein
MSDRCDSGRREQTLKHVCLSNTPYYSVLRTDYRNPYSSAKMHGSCACYPGNKCLYSTSPTPIYGVRSSLFTLCARFRKSYFPSTAHVQIGRVLPPFRAPSLTGNLYEPNLIAYSRLPLPFTTLLGTPYSVLASRRPRLPFISRSFSAETTIQEP